MMAGPVRGFFSVNHSCDNNALSYPSKKDTTCNIFFFFFNQNCGDICCFPVLHIRLWLKEHLRRKQQLFLGYGFNVSKGDTLMARIKAIFGRVNTQAKSVQFVCGKTTVKARAIIGQKKDYAARWTI